MEVLLFSYEFGVGSSEPFPKKLLRTNYSELRTAIFRLLIKSPLQSLHSRCNGRGFRRWPFSPLPLMGGDFHPERPWRLGSSRVCRTRTEWPLFQQRPSEGGEALLP